VKQVKRLFNEFQPEHYDLYLAPDRAKLEFTGRVVIRGRKTGRPSSRITLHQKDLKILSAKITKHDKRTGAAEVAVQRVNTQKSFDELRLHAAEPLYPGQYVIELEFSGKITKPMHGIYPCDYEIDGQKKQLIATQFESHHAREAFPGVDEPEAKATFDLTLASPAGETAISNSPVKSQTKKGGRLETVFETTPKMSTYLLAFVFGELDYKSTKTDMGVEVRVYATPDKVGLTDFALDVGIRCLEFFEDYYGMPYPLPKLDLIGLPDFSAGAMENWGLITFRESVLYVDSVNTSVETKESVAMVICHEIAHMWFGNLVTMKWWNDLWLNESFANMMEYLAVDKLFPEWDIWRDFTRRETGSAMSRDSLPNVQPVQTDVNHPDELSSLFDPAIVYAKGGSLLNMVRHLIGETAFRQGLKTYFQKFQYANTTADDLWDHLESASGVKIGRLMSEWLDQPGFPAVEVSYEPAEKTFTASQERLVLTDKKQSKTVWQVPLAASDKLDNDILAARESKFTITKKSSDYPLMLNHDGRSYFVPQYLNKSHIDLIHTAIAKSILSPIDRLLYVQNNALLEKNNRQSTLENIKLMKVYNNEREESVWSLLAGILGNARALIDKDEELESRLNGFVRPLAAPLVAELGWDGAKNEPAHTLKLRGLALSLAAGSQDQNVIKEGLRRFAAFTKPSDLVPDIRTVVYYISVRYGSAKDFDKMIKLHNSLANADEKDEVAAELTATRDKQRIDRLLGMITTDKVRQQDSPTWYAWLLRNRYATDQAWRWLNDNWGWVEKSYSSDKSYDRFPRYSAMVFSKPEQLKMYKTFFDDKTSIALERPIKLGIEEIEGRIAWRQANEQPVKDWLLGLKD
jgi:aminopeptidase N